MDIILVRDVHWSNISHDLRRFRAASAEALAALKKHPAELAEIRRDFDAEMQGFAKARKSMERHFIAHRQRVFDAARGLGVKRVYSEGRKDVVENIIGNRPGRGPGSADNLILQAYLHHNLNAPKKTPVVPLEGFVGTLKSLKSFVGTLKSDLTRDTSNWIYRKELEGVIPKRMLPLTDKAFYKLSDMTRDTRREADTPMAEKFAKAVAGRSGACLVVIGADHADPFKKRVGELLPGAKFHEYSAPEIDHEIDFIRKHYGRMNEIRKKAKLDSKQLGKPKATGRPARKLGTRKSLDRK